MLYKTVEFQNVVGQKVKVVDIPVVGRSHRYYFMIQARLQMFITPLYNQPQTTSCFSFRDYLKRKMKWSDFQNLYTNDNQWNNNESLTNFPTPSRNNHFSSKS
ncbi:hypothetical protein BTR23_10075 [Alkalihalophilus pseudofirmus]|uniref:DUF2535 family protein n=1 Tax=Alkalihalobacterium alkalinitrilicum TaxID=427920 RepID=UPI00094DA7A9|nr:DUF2535 family protein [Alkalihalobacterium alkalinitrilicum]OLO39376.1 hypothetical protein BTR23_10075 [Alkalihalophilus pseudofirmus]